MKKIWIINHYAVPPSLGINVRQFYFARELKEHYRIKIISSGRIHNSNINMNQNGENKVIKSYDGVKFYFLKNINENTTLKRILNILQFAKKILFYKEIDDELPDVIYCSSGDIFAAAAALCLAKKKKIPCIMEIRDLWPLSIVEYSSKLTDNNIIVKILYQLEKWCYKTADALIFTMPGGGEYIKNKGWDDIIDSKKIFNINNGIDLKEFKENSKLGWYDEDLDSDKFKVVYTGSIRKANRILELVKAATYLKENKDIIFLIYGAGNYVNELETFIKENNLENVKYKGVIEKKRVPYILKKSNLNVFYLMDNRVWNYGLSLNKMFEYFASGKPILINGETPYNLINENKLGVMKKMNPKEFAEKILEIKDYDEARLLRIKENNIKVIKDYTWERLSRKLINVIDFAIHKGE